MASNRSAVIPVRLVATLPQHALVFSRVHRSGTFKQAVQELSKAIRPLLESQFDRANYAAIELVVSQGYRGAMKVPVVPLVVVVVVIPVAVVVPSVGVVPLVVPLVVVVVVVVVVPLVIVVVVPLVVIVAVFGVLVPLVVVVVVVPLVVVSPPVTPLVIVPLVVVPVLDVFVVVVFVVLVHTVVFRVTLCKDLINIYIKTRIASAYACHLDWGRQSGRSGDEAESQKLVE